MPNLQGDNRNEGLAEINYPLHPKYRDLGVEPVYECGSRASIWRRLDIAPWWLAHHEEFRH